MDVLETNKAAAARFIAAFNTAAWDDLPAIVAPDFVLHHPMGGTMRLGPEGMAQVWGHFQSALPDARHPIPVLVAEGDCVATLLPTYGHFTGTPHQGIPPTGRWLEYGMVNIVRLDGGKLVEGWFGMDPLVELQQMGAAPAPPPRTLSACEASAVELFTRRPGVVAGDFDTITAFGDTVVALGPSQHASATRTRTLEILRVEDGALCRVRSDLFTTNPPYGGDASVDTEASRALVADFFERVLTGHDVDALAELASPDILIHPAAMPCEAGFYGLAGAEAWLRAGWDAFADLTVTVLATVAGGDLVAVRWHAHGTSSGPFLGLPSTGQLVEYDGVSLYRVAASRIAEIWDTRNSLGILLQLNPDLASGHDHH